MMINQNLVNPNCKLEIVIEPHENIKRPRYAKEGNKHGTLSKRGGFVVYGNRGKKSCPIVQIKNYTENPGEETFIQCSLSTVDYNRGPHFHELTRAISRFEEQEEFIVINVKKTKKFTATFANLKITWTKKEDRLSMFKRKLTKYYREQSISESKLSNAEEDKYLDGIIKTINCNEMCLKFEAFTKIKGGEEKHPICDPAFSQVIKKSVGRVATERVGKQNVNIDKRRKRKQCSAFGEEPQDCSGKKQCHRNNACKNNNLGEARQTRVLKQKNESSLHNKGVLRHRPTPITEEFRGQELTRAQDREQEIFTNESIHPASEIAENQLLSSPNIGNEWLYILPEHKEHLPLLNVDDQDFECHSALNFSESEDSDCLYHPESSRVLEGLYLDGSQDIEVLFSDVSSLIKDIPADMPNIGSTLYLCKEMSEIAGGEAGANSGLCGVFKVFKNLWDQTKIYIILPLLLLITVFEMRIGVVGFTLLLLNWRGRNHLYLNIFCKTFRTIIFFYVLILKLLLCYVFFKLVIWVLVIVIHSRLITAERKVKCILTFVNLLLRDLDFSGQVFDDRVLSHLSKKEEQRVFSSPVKVSKLRKLIALLREKILRNEQIFVYTVQPYNLQRLCRKVLWFSLGVFLILYSYKFYDLSTDSFTFQILWGNQKSTLSKSL